jgi:addiction module HigA family antidote
MPTMSKSPTIIEPGDPIPLETPGDILRQDFLEPAGITAYQLAKAIGVPPMYISKILHGGGVSPKMGILLDLAFGMSSGFWSRLQAEYDTRDCQARARRPRVRAREGRGIGLPTRLAIIDRSAGLPAHACLGVGVAHRVVKQPDGRPSLGRPTRFHQDR